MKWKIGGEENLTEFGGKGLIPLYIHIRLGQKSHFTNLLSSIYICIFLKLTIFNILKWKIGGDLNLEERIWYHRIHVPLGLLSSIYIYNSILLKLIILNILKWKIGGEENLTEFWGKDLIPLYSLLDYSPPYIHIIPSF